MNFSMINIVLNDVYNLVQETFPDKKNEQKNNWSKDELTRMIRARIDLPIVSQLRQEGYNIKLIEYVDFHV